MSDSIQRKCQVCGSWNDGSLDNCSNCGELLNPKMVLEKYHEAKDRERLKVPRSKLDDLVDRFKNSRNPFIMILYAVLKGVWFVYWVILSFILWIIAAGPG